LDTIPALSHGWALILQPMVQVGRRFRSDDASRRPTRSILLKQLWSPWRIEYILNKKPSICVFCEAFQADAALDRDYLIVHRGTHASVIMNLYPYNNGHLMVIPYAHQTTFEGLPSEALAEVMALMNQSVAVLRQALNAEGFNIGVNLGKVAGAGLEQHVHLHVVPRWAGDTNFITTVGKVRCIPESMQDTYDKLKTAWE
jgi:ATP adenylyltransferase